MLGCYAVRKLSEYLRARCAQRHRALGARQARGAAKVGWCTSNLRGVILVGDSHAKGFRDTDTRGNAGQPYHQRRRDFCTRRH